MPSTINDVGQNYRRAFASSNFGTRGLKFYAIYYPPNDGIAAGQGGATYSENPVGAATELGNGTMDLFFQGNLDDDYVGAINPPFPVTFLGQTYTELYVGSNSYLTFGGGTNNYNFNDDPTMDGANLPAILVSEADNSVQQVFTKTEGSTGSRTFRIRYEGDDSTGGTIGAPTIVWEIVFYEANPGYVDLVVAADARGSDGVSGVTSGTSWEDHTTDHFTPFIIGTTRINMELPGEPYLDSNSYYGQVVRAVQGACELYLIGKPAGTPGYETFTFVTADDTSLHGTIVNALNAAGISYGLVEMTVGPVSIYSPL